MSRQEDWLLNSIQSPALKLCQELCGQYEWSAEPWRKKNEILICAVMTFFSYDPDFVQELAEMLVDAQRDTRLGRGEAELEDWMRDNRAKKEGV
jgi:hypothetical protein